MAHEDRAADPARNVMREQIALLDARDARYHIIPKPGITGVATAAPTSYASAMVLASHSTQEYQEKRTPRRLR